MKTLDSPDMRLSKLLAAFSEVSPCWVSGTGISPMLSTMRFMALGLTHSLLASLRMDRDDTFLPSIVSL